MINLAKIPFHIISGFLGSGKTTFLKRIIKKYASEYKIGIVQNEFAPVNVDSIELKNMGHDFHLLEVNNGSVFCVCLLGNFTHSLEEFIDLHNPDLLIIEASGLSDTTSISEIISAGSLSAKIFLASNWCIVDAVNFQKSGLMKQRIVHQLRMSDIVVINKTDLVHSNLDNIHSEIKKINPFAEIRETKYCDLDFELGLKPVNKFYFSPWKSLSRPDINSMVIKSGKKILLKSLEIFLKEWSSKAYRIKGYVNLKEGITVAVQCIFDTTEIKTMEKMLLPTELIALSDQFTLHEWNLSFRKLV